MESGIGGYAVRCRTEWSNAERPMETSADAHGVIRARQELAVTGAVAVRPDLRGSVEPRFEPPDLLGASHVGSDEVAGEPSVGRYLQSRREHRIDTEQPADRVEIQRGGRGHDHDLVS